MGGPCPGSRTSQIIRDPGQAFRSGQLQTGLDFTQEFAEQKSRRPAARRLVAGRGSKQYRQTLLKQEFLLQCRSMDERLTVGELQHQFPEAGGSQGTRYHRVAAKPAGDGALVSSSPSVICPDRSFFRSTAKAHFAPAILG